MQKKAVVFKHLQQEGSCHFGRILNNVGWQVQSISVSREDISDFDALDPDLLIVMGGNIGVYQADDYPFVYDEIDIIERRLNAGKAVMGICLGSQIMAKTLGGKVEKGAVGKEIGWYGLNAAADLEDDHPIRYIMGDKTSMFHWHGDTFDLPPSARLLASSELYPNQIYEYSHNAIGLQCHPEVTEDQLKEWFVLFHSQILEQHENKTVHDLRLDTAKYAETLNLQSEKFFLSWLRRAGLSEEKV